MVPKLLARPSVRTAQGGPHDHLCALATAPRRGPAVRCRGIAPWKGHAPLVLHEDLPGDWSSRGRNLYKLIENRRGWGPGSAIRLIGQVEKAARACTSTAVTCPASTHPWLRQIPQTPQHQRQSQRTGVPHTRPPPLAAQGGTGGGNRAGDRAGSAAGAVPHR